MRASETQIVDVFLTILGFLLGGGNQGNYGGNNQGFNNGGNNRRY